MKEVVDKTLDPRVSGYMMADTVIFSFTNFGPVTHVFPISHFSLVTNDFSFLRLHMHS